LAIAIARRGDLPRSARWLTVLFSAMAIGQAMLGIATISSSRDLIVMTLHSTMGAALFASIISVYWILRPSALPDGLTKKGITAVSNVRVEAA
jgi:heme A synthase